MILIATHENISEDEYELSPNFLFIRTDNKIYVSSNLDIEQYKEDIFKIIKANLFSSLIVFENKGNDSYDNVTFLCDQYNCPAYVKGSKILFDKNELFSIVYDVEDEDFVY